MDADIEAYFGKVPGTLPLYEAVERAVRAVAPRAKIKVHKTQITFYDKYNFAFVWLPIRKMRGRPEVYVIMSFDLGRQETNPRIVQSVETYPGRWVHHVVIQSADEIDDQVIGWLREAYEFSLSK
jgi:predicted transport protein